MDTSDLTPISDSNPPQANSPHLPKLYSANFLDAKNLPETIRKLIQNRLELHRPSVVAMLKRSSVGNEITQIAPAWSFSQALSDGPAHPARFQ